MAKSRTNRKMERYAKYFAIAGVMILGGVLQFRWVLENQSVKNPFKAKYVKKALCSHCDGHGVVPFWMDEAELRECPVCYGAGARLVKMNPEFQQFCPSCFGLGRLYHRDTHHAVQCFTCLGRGAVLRGYLQPAEMYDPSVQRPAPAPPAESDAPVSPAPTGDPDDV